MSNSRNKIEILLQLLMGNYAQGMKDAAESTEKFGDKVKNQKATADSTSSALAGLESTVKNLILAYASFNALQKFATDLVQTVGEAQNLNTRLESLTKGANDFAETQSYLSQTANKLGVDYNTYSTGYAKLLGLQQAGLMTTDEARKVTEGLSNVMKSTGATTANLNQGFYGFAQALSSPILHMEELNQITEPFPGFMQALDKANGGVAGSFRRLTGEGKITGEMFRTVALKAFESYSGSAEKMAGNLIPTFTRLNNTYIELKKELDSPVNALLLPVMEQAQKILVDFTEYVKQNKNALTEQAKSVADFIVQLMQGIAALTQFIANHQTLLTSIGAMAIAFPVLNSLLGIATTAVTSLTAATVTAKVAFTALSATPLGLALAAVAVGIVAVSAALDSSKNSLAETDVKFKTTTDSLKFFRDSIDGLKSMGTVGQPVVAEIEKIRAAFMAGKISESDAKKQVENLISEARKNVQEREQLEKDLVAKKKQIEEKKTQITIDETDKQIKEAKKGLEEAERDLENHYKKIEKLEEEFTKLQEDNESSLRELKRKGMTDTVAQGDKLLEYFEKLKASREAADSGDFKLSSELAKDAQKLSKELGNVQSILNALEKNTNSNEKAVLEQTRQSLNRQIQEAMNRGDYKAIEELNKKAQELTKNLGTQSSAGQKELADKIRQVWAEESEAFGGELADKTEKYKSNLDTQIALANQANIAAESAKRRQIDSEEAAADEKIQEINDYKNEIATLEQKLETLGKPRKTVIEADVLKAEKELAKLEEKLNKLKNTQINVSASTSVNATGHSTGGIIGYNTGGIAGYDSGGILPGYGGGDRRLAMLEDGEGVLNKQSTSRFKDLFLMMNYKPEQFAQFISPLTNGIQGFNVGGIVNNIASQIPSFNTSAAGATNSGGNLTTFRLELASGDKTTGVTLMGEQSEIAKLNKALRRFSK